MMTTSITDNDSKKIPLLDDEFSPCIIDVESSRCDVPDEKKKLLQAITAAGQEEQEPNNAATVAVEGPKNTASTVSVVVEEPNSNKRLWIAYLAILALTAIAVTLSLLTQMTAIAITVALRSKAAVVFDESPSRRMAPTTTMMMTRRANKVKTILADYVYSPLDEEALNWLTNDDTWEPDADDPNHDYLWLERYAMVLLYDSTNGTSWTNSIHWKTSEPVCKWYFVTQQECPGPISNLALNGNNLRGSLPSVIGNLSQLKWLDLGSNQLTSSIPSSIGNLSKLESLFLYDNQLTSSIPSSIGNLSLLEGLYLWGNQLTSSVPSSIGNLSQLQELDLWNNQLTSSIPSSIGNLTLLTFLSLYDNELTGSIPSLPSSITWCELQNNCFDDELGNGEAAGCIV